MGRSANRKARYAPNPLVCHWYAKDNCRPQIAGHRRIR
jgi:hypothetical protein